MTKGLESIQARQKALIAECAAERLAFAAAWEGLQKPVAAGQRAVNALRSPWLWGAAGLIALKLPKKRMLQIPILLWKGWKLARRIRALTGR
jgi:hypothetical protein